MKNKIIFLFFLGFSILLNSQNSTKIDSLKNELIYALSDSTKFNANLQIGKIYSRNSNDSSFNYFNNALDIAIRTGNKLKQANVLHRIGLGYQYKNDFKNAILNFKKSVLIYKELNLNSDVALLYNSIGYNYVNLYAENKAIEYFLKSLALNRDVLDDNAGIAMNLVDIGNLYFEQENYKYAKEEFEEALKIYEELEDNEGISVCIINIGNVISEEGNVIEGLDYYFKSIELFEKENDKIGIASNYNNIGDNYIDLKEYSKAEYYFDKSLKIVSEIEDKELEAILCLNFSEVYIKQNKFNKAVLSAKEGIDISKKIGNLRLEIENLYFLATAYEGIGNESIALKYLKEHTEKKNNLINADKLKKIQLFNTLNELEKYQLKIDDLSLKHKVSQIKYQTEKNFTYFLVITLFVFAVFVIILILQHTSKKKAYNLLAFKNYQINKMNAEIHKQSDKLKVANVAKDKFFSIIAHDLKNPFNSIKGFTDLLIENIGLYDDKKRLKFLKIIRDSSTQASGLLNNLLIWANNQSGNLKFNPEKIELVSQVSDVISLVEMQAINKEIVLCNNVDPNLYVMADINMLNTVLRNLVSNAIKFTDKQGVVKVISIVKDDFVEITVEDTGVGMSQDQIGKLFNIDEKNSNAGTFNEKGSGLGLILCKDFVEKHGDVIRVESTPNVGSTFKFNIPIVK